MDQITELLIDLRREHGVTLARLQREQIQSEKEKSEIATLEAALRIIWDKTNPGEPLPLDLLGEPAPRTQEHQAPLQNGLDPISRARQSILNAIDAAQVRFTTKDIFPSVPEIVSEEVTESFGYEFLKRQVAEGKLWVFQQGAGRRATTYSKAPVEPPKFAIATRSSQFSPSQFSSNEFDDDLDESPDSEVPRGQPQQAEVL